MTDVLVGDALLELAKAKELASVMGGAWHSTEEDVDLDSDSELPSSSSGNIEVGVKSSVILFLVLVSGVLGPCRASSISYLSVFEAHDGLNPFMAGVDLAAVPFYSTL